MKVLTWKRLAWIAGGGAAGFAWYYFVGCRTGACPISSNPYISVAYGAIVGVIASWNKPKSKNESNN